VDSGRVERFDATLDEYPAWLAARRAAEEAPSTEAGISAHSAAARRERRRLEAEKRRRLQPLRDKVRRLETDIERLGARKADLERQLSAPEIYADEAKERLKTLLLEQGDLAGRLEAAEEAWLALHEEMEALAGE
jgi:ATP-binding cassette subfamily F protein 3